MSLQAFSKSYKQLIHVFNEGPKQKNLFDSMFSDTMVGLDTPAFSSALTEHERPNPETTQKEEPSIESVVAQYQAQQASVYAVQQKLYAAMGALPSTYLTDHVTNTLATVGNSKFWQWYKLPSQYARSGARLTVSVHTKLFEARPLLQMLLAKIGIDLSLTKAGFVQKTKDQYQIMVESDWLPSKTTDMVLMQAEQIKQSAIIHVSGICIDNQDNVLYKAKNDTQPLLPIVMGPCCSEWTSSKPFKNKLAELLLAEIQKYSPSAKASFLDDQTTLEIQNVNAKDLEGMLTIRARAEPLPSTFDRMDKYVLLNNDPLVEDVLVHAGAELSSAIQNFRSRAIAVLVLVVVSVIILILGLVILISRLSHKKPSVRTMGTLENTSAKQTLSGGQATPIETLSLLIDNLKHRVENL